MNYTINPFQQLYFSDNALSENNFVELFSEEVLQTAINPVFQGGNMVLLGTQGCGKTMILSLLRPETRIAYFNTGKDFPVDKKLSRFISAGVNLTRSGITEIVQATLSKGEDVDAQILPLFFADFFNYWVIDDLLNSIQTIGERPDVFAEMVDLNKIPEFIELLVKQDCWFGALQGVSSIVELKQRIAERIGVYRRWINGNLPEGQPPLAIFQSKTNIGEPIARTAECLRKSKIIGDDVPVLIRVDQIEEMHRAFTLRQQRILLTFRKIINRAFAGRDARVHYRAGSRRYGWNNPDFLMVWGSEARLEKRRDYLLVDMDQELFAQGETKNTIFERLALDAFYKRIQYFLGSEAKYVRKDLAKRAFGKHPTAADRLSHLNSQADTIQIDRALGLDVAGDKGKWSVEWRAFLRDLYRSGPEGILNSVLAVAWARQTGGARHTRQHRESPPPTDAPWRERKWWRKERLDQAVLQVSTRCQQRFLWWGYADVLSLSGANITVFLHICHRIWDGFLKSQSSLPKKDQVDVLRGGEIDKNIQTSAILFASNEWFRKLTEEPEGDARQRFVEELGKHLNAKMMDDLSMSYPGGNGISIKESEFESRDVADLRRFVRDSVGFGVLFETSHSSKSKKGGRRIKFYLNPILCPRYQLPEAKTKEPIYWNMSNLYALIKKAKITLSRPRSSKDLTDEETALFPGFKDLES